MDIAIIRENLEGEYSGVEHEVYPGVYESLKIVTKASSLRIAEYAFEFAFLCGRQKVTAVHKANIMKLADGLFLEACREVAEKYPMVAYEEMIIDNCSMQMVKNPWQFDVMVMPNLYGSIVTHTASGLCGGSGVTAGANIGKEFALFEQGCRSAARGIEGKGVANPSAALYASVNLLRTAGLPRFADVIEKGLLQVYTDGKVNILPLCSLNGTFHTEFLVETGSDTRCGRQSHKQPIHGGTHQENKRESEGIKRKDDWLRSK